MEHKEKVVHFLYIPFTGLGLYNGFRGNRWLKNRIQIFKQFVIPSLLNQTSKDFVVWCSWRYEEKKNPLVKRFIEEIKLESLQFVHTFNGVCFWDDKYPDRVARERLLTNLHGSLIDLIDVLGDAKYVLMSIQPSDDCYKGDFVAGIKNVFEQNKDLQAAGFNKGYICNYATKEVKEYNPKTNPPFYTIKFPREIFIDPIKHAEYTSLKHDVGKYKQGTPLPSHEYVKDCLKYGSISERGFMVGVHGENISTVFNHPYAGEEVESSILKDFGIADVFPITIHYSMRKRILRMLPHGAQRKLRYWFGELLWQRMYEWLRG